MAGRVADMIRGSLLYRAVTEYRIWRSERKRFLQEAYAMTDVSPEELKEYVSDMEEYRISPSEYFRQYRFHSLDKAGRRAFITRSEMQKVYRRLVSKDVRLVFQVKPEFLRRFAPFIVRKWILADENADMQILRELLSDHDVIVKPVDGALGQGIYKLMKEESRERLDTLCTRLVGEKVLVEECVRAIGPIEEFHPASLNTIRVVTFSNGNDAEVVGAFIRFGCHGSVVDNAHAGGIFATIDVSEGKTISNGLDTDGNEYVLHPDSQKSIKGFVIPHWDDIVSTCLEAVRVIPDLRFAGWDCVVLPDGRIDILEGNHGPDVDVMQSPLKVGIRSDIKDRLKSYFNYDL
ncbi:MAG: hypothetical protein IJ971_09045 [Bacteroidales bacterium]|nr:hypothetical protein [Bacteroidales bacterium]